VHHASLASIRTAALLVAALVMNWGCVSLRPFEDVKAGEPPDNFVCLGEQLVHVEQAGAGEAVLLVHGFGGSTYSWRHVMPTLAGSFRVVALDLSGFGWTERPRDREPYTIDGQADLVLGVADALGIDRFHLVGHSYGGGISLWIAARNAERLRSLVLVDSTLPAYAAERRRTFAGFRPLVSLFLRTAALRPWFIRLGLERSVHDPRTVTDEMVDEYLRRLAVEGAVDSYQGLTARTEGPVPMVDLASIRVPALVVWGADDPLLAAHYGEKAAWTMPDARFVSIPDCGHLPMEERPDEFLAAVVPFLGEPEH
jgi:pimeloyl-ACP methyl ester carboxylesterase